MHFISVVGTRPQLVKASAIIREIKRHWPSIKHSLIHTGQHYDDNMSNNVIDSLGIETPDINFQIGSDTHGAMTGTMIKEIEKALDHHKPDWCLNYGDTNTTLATAIAAVKLNIKVAHVEAGMRRYDLSIPEEVNRRVTDHVSNILFTSSEQYSENLRKEAVPGEIMTVGDINLDSFTLMMERLENTERLIEYEYALSTIHRPINTDDKKTLQNIFNFFDTVPCKIVLPLHPRTIDRNKQYKLKIPKNVEVIKPVSFDRMLLLLRDSKFVITDSGGLQKEAFFAKKKCITLNKDTPWIELRELGVNRPIEPSKLNIVDILSWVNAPLPEIQNPYGDGTTRKKIVKALVEKT